MTNTSSIKSASLLLHRIPSFDLAVARLDRLCKQRTTQGIPKEAIVEVRSLLGTPEGGSAPTSAALKSLERTHREACASLEIAKKRLVDMEDCVIELSSRVTKIEKALIAEQDSFDDFSASCRTVVMGMGRQDLARLLSSARND